jgi:hypothetical protein
MALSTRNVKFVLRIGVAVMAALTLGLAVRLVLENAELNKLLPSTSTRTLLLIAAPLTSLAMLHLVLAVRTLSLRSLAMEIVLLLGETALFIAIVSPLLIGSWAIITGAACGRWFRACPDEVVWISLWWVQPAGFVTSIFLIVFGILYGLKPIHGQRLKS